MVTIARNRPEGQVLRNPRPRASAHEGDFTLWEATKMLRRPAFQELCFYIVEHSRDWGTAMADAELKILVVDDDAAMLRIVSSVFLCGDEGLHLPCDRLINPVPLWRYRVCFLWFGSILKYRT